MGNSLLMYTLIFGLMFGGLGGAKLSSLNPFKAKTKASIVQKDESNKEEYFRDKIKGIEYRSKERHKAQNTVNAPASKTIGQKIGNVIDSSLQLIVIVLIGGIALFFFTGINIFKKIKKLTIKANNYRKGLKQTVGGIQASKGKMNGEFAILLNELRDRHDDDTELIIKEMKNE